jgi:hypothetical protein
MWLTVLPWAWAAKGRQAIVNNSNIFAMCMAIPIKSIFFSNFRRKPFEYADSETHHSPSG